MRKFLKIVFIISSAVFFFRLLFRSKISEDIEIYMYAAYLIILIPYTIYELRQVIKDDKINKTHVFRNRMILAAIAAAFLILNSIYLNSMV